jgi:diadenosine tetraphosphatase ApaH/serine/threonine PP2A family protein phosphatase
VRFLYGNGEVAVLEAIAGKKPSAVPEQYWPVIEWTARQVSGYEAALRSWPMTVELEMPALGRVLFCHATPRDDNEIFTRLTPEAKLLPVFDAAGAPLVVCGHTHMPFDRMVGRTRVINAGSAGMPFGRTGADWLLLGDAGAELQHTSYDLEAAARRIRASAYPDREGFVENYLLHPPSEEQMLAAFAAAEVTSAGS